MFHRASFRIKRRYARFRLAWPLLRGLAVTSLILSLAIGGVRWLSHPYSAGALEFSPRVVGIETGAVGVQGIATGDLDGDGDADVITAGLDGVKVYENEGDFSFALHVVDDKKAERVQVIDLDGDTRLDILISIKGEKYNSVRWYKNMESFEFSGRDLGLTHYDPKIYAGDINGDGSVDIVTAGIDGDNSVLQRWMNNGSGVFTAVIIDNNSKVTSIAIGDLNHNGYKDIVTGGGAGLQKWDTTNGVTWIRADLDDSNANATALYIGDPKNGQTWIASVDSNVNEVVIYRSGENIDDYADYGRGRRILATGIDGKSIKTIDLDDDGDLDVLVAAQDDNVVYWYDNDGTDNFTQRVIATGLQSVYDVAAVDLDGDGDIDVLADNHIAGTVYAFERTRAKPVATAPNNIQQSIKGTGRVSFQTTLSDGDRDLTRIRIQYSVDGDHWYKPWITSAVVDNGTIDLKNSNGYQIGSRDGIDTSANDKVTITINWDTKSAKNTGGPIVNDIDSVRLRIIPRDDISQGDVAFSSKFRVDNGSPQGLTGLTLKSIGENKADFSWTAATDSTGFSYKIYYGTDHAAVLEQRSDSWDASNDADMDDIENTTTTITGLEKNKTYTFKLFAIDKFGNSVAAPSVRGTTVEDSSEQGSPTPTLEPETSPDDFASPEPEVSPEPETSPDDFASPEPEVSSEPEVSPDYFASPTPEASSLPTEPPTLKENRSPEADAGPDKVVNPSALVIMDGTASYDPDSGETATLIYSWRQVDGPRIELLSSHTATASFTAGGENETYIFTLTVQDKVGASSIDTVTVATKKLPTSEPYIGVDTKEQSKEEDKPVSPVVKSIFGPLDIFLFVLSIISTLILLAERVVRTFKEGQGEKVNKTSIRQSREQGKVVHYKTGKPIAGAQVLVYDENGKLRLTQRTNDQGVFTTFFPVGQYTIGVKAQGFVFAASALKSIADEESIIYAGGKINVKDANKPIPLLIPMKPTADEVSSTKVSFLQGWQVIQRWGRLSSWPIFLSGALLNTALVFLSPSTLYLSMEVMYIVLVVLKIALEVRVRPAYGQVRDAITRIPLDLAVVRLFEQNNNKLVMTRVTNNQGKFFALPPAGEYTVTVSKPGYATFTKENLQIKSEHDTTLQMTADLMPITPNQAGGLSKAKAAIL